MREYRRLVNTIPPGGTLVEVGVWLGRSLCSVAEVVKKRGLTVIAVDPFTKTHAILSPPPKGGQLVAFQSNMAAYGLDPVIRVMKSLDAAPTVRYASLVFLDADHHYEAVKADIAAWRTRCRILAGHDYCPLHPGVMQAVDEMFPNATIHGNIWSVRFH
jgi:cephalosporin hydroxylase